MESKTAQKCSEGNTVTSEQKAMRCRGFCFTDFRSEKPVFNSEIMKYLCFAPEECPTTLKKHWQSYVYWIHPKTLTSTAKYFGKSHCEFQRGTFDEAIMYCSGPYDKNGKVKPVNSLFEEFGERPSQGARSDLTVLRNNILAGTTVDEIAMEDPVMFHQYGRTLERLEDIANRKRFRTFMTTCDWHCGPTGSNKSRTVYEGFHPDTHYNLVDDNGWWEGYKGQECVIINDFRGSIPYDTLLQLIDRYPYSVKRRGREPMPFTSKHIMITSPLTPEECYPNRCGKDSIEQLLRRVNVIRHSRLSEELPSTRNSLGVASQFFLKSI